MWHDEQELGSRGIVFWIQYSTDHLALDFSLSSGVVQNVIVPVFNHPATTIWYGGSDFVRVA
jgi:hypothetical protein